MRVRLDGEPTFREVLRQVRQTAFGQLRTSRLPYQKLVEELSPDRDISRNPLVQVMFTCVSRWTPKLDDSRWVSSKQVFKPRSLI